MIAFYIMITAISFFSLGFILGTVFPTPKRPVMVCAEKTADDGQLERLRREYGNFLSYDGSEQA